MRRRDFVTATAATGLAAALLPAGPAQATALPASPIGPLERALIHPAPARPLTLGELTRALAAGRAAFSRTRYTALGVALPALLASAEATRDRTAAGRARERAHGAVARGYVLATELAVKQHSPIAHTTSGRALAAARSSGDPRVIAAAARMTAITMRRSGQASEAAAFLARTARDLSEGHRGDPPPAVLDATTVLLLTAGYSAAVAGSRGTALALHDEAEETLGRITRAHRGDGLFTHAATPAQAAMYRISTYTVLGTPDDGIPYAHSVSLAALPTAERRARFLTDSGRMWNRIGDGPRTYAALRAIERTAPEELRRPALRMLTAELLHSPQHLRGIRDFADRHGALL
ncbi:transcriptional regulator [Streptomyces tsukubensis]